MRFLKNHKNPTTLDFASLRPEFARPRHASELRSLRTRSHVTGSGRIFRMPKIENSFTKHPEFSIFVHNVCAPKGFKALGKSVGIKKLGKPDFAVIFSEVLADAAAVYTSNKVKGAPLIITKKHLENGKAQAIVVNSGCANVCTGEKGIKDAEDTAKYIADELGINANDVLTASTGLIGSYLPMDKIKKGIKGVRSELRVCPDVADAILTTDKAKKEI